MHRLYWCKSFPQSGQLLLDDGDLGFGVGFLLAFLIDHGGRSAIDKAFVGELGLHALQEALGVFQLLFELFDFGL